MHQFVIQYTINEPKILRFTRPLEHPYKRVATITFIFKHDSSSN